MSSEDSWPCEAYGGVACREFYMPDESQLDEAHLSSCSDCFRVIMARRVLRLLATS